MKKIKFSESKILNILKEKEQDYTVKESFSVLVQHLQNSKLKTISTTCRKNLPYTI